MHELSDVMNPGQFIVRGILIQKVKMAHQGTDNTRYEGRTAPKTSLVDLVQRYLVIQEPWQG